MIRTITILALGLGLALPAAAGPDKVAFPDGYRSDFVRYTTVDKPNRDPPIVRFMYVNKASLAAARPNQPLPYGTVVVMEDHEAELDDQDRPVTDAEGRLVPTERITNVFVQEKQAGWGAEYPPEKRNGEWEYAWFEADGSRKQGDFVKFDDCFACHAEQAKAQDYTFTLWGHVTATK